MELASALAFVQPAIAQRVWGLAGPTLDSTACHVVTASGREYGVMFLARRLVWVCSANISLFVFRLVGRLAVSSCSDGTLTRSRVELQR